MPSPAFLRTLTLWIILSTTFMKFQTCQHNTVSFSSYLFTPACLLIAYILSKIKFVSPLQCHPVIPQKAWTHFMPQAPFFLWTSLANILLFIILLINILPLLNCLKEYLTFLLILKFSTFCNTTDSFDFILVLWIFSLRILSIVFFSYKFMFLRALFTVPQLTTFIFCIISAAFSYLIPHV